ncbi:AMP-binding protein [Chitinimonas arctica]|uniref:AMP-binding protein n=1 Tax=Chitinimonas arctica TaxID=2594795 RepID=A0A516SKQ3_9NEIS|nr:condensation domain-containing protein [Chitinimonas arctica]QDQ28742.1 AMP-binding protein [Chitinimonas arctica]
MSSQEARLYAQYRLYPQSLAYLLEMAIPLPAGIAQEAVATALQALLERHDILRTRYRVEADGTPYAEVLPELAASDVLVEPAAWPLARNQPFALEEGPLLRACMQTDGQGGCLQLQIHHILVDEPAMATLRGDFERLLDGETLPATGPGYRHYALALAEARRQPLWETAQRFWRDYLQGLAFDPFGHGAVEEGGRMASLSWQLSAAEQAACQRVCAELKLTPASFFLALWGLVVAREGSSDAFSISVANAYGARQGLETVGMFVSLVPCSLRFGRDNPSFADYARQLADTQWQVMEQLFFPVEEVFPLLEPDPRRFGSNPLLNVAYSYLEGGASEPTVATDSNGVEAQGPLSLAIQHGDGQCRLALEYQPTLFTAARIERLAACWRELLQQLASHAPADWKVDDWVGATASFRPAVRHESGPAIDAILRQSFLQLGGRPAVIDDAGELSWQEFAALTAGYVQRLNVTSVRRALILGTTGRQLQAFLAACFLTRTTYLALEDGTPEARVEEVRQHAAPDLVIDTGRETVTPLAFDWAGFESVKTLADNPTGWILYSSGTTGRPKGICVAAETVAAYLASLVERLRLPAGVRVTQQFSPSFDGYLEEVLLAWAMQGTSLVVDRYSLLDERKARAFLQQRRPDVISAAPALLSAWNRISDLQPLPRVCISGGDFLAPADINRLRAHMQIWNSYGPTETCIAASMLDCSQVQAGATLSIGTPFAHVAFSVVDAEGRRLRPGQWGELLIHGDFARHGYLDDPERTAERFGSDENGFYFRTGDMAMAGHDGQYFLRGRMDDSCKVRGNFIGLGELEGKASQYPGVLAAGAAVAWPGMAEACLVLAVEGQPDSLGGLQQHLARHYTRSHLPSAIFPLAQLPRTDTGKLDRAGVVAQFHAWRERAQPVSGEIEQDEDLLALMACWRDCLNYQGPLGRDADFFLVSGSSLSAVRLAGQIETRFGVSFSPVDVFRHATVAGQQALIAARRLGESAAPVSVRQLNADVAGTPSLILLPPALGGLQELQALADRWSGQVAVSVLTLAPEAAEALSEAAFETALLQTLQPLLAAAGRPVWLGGYSLGAEMLAALLERHPALADGIDRLVFLDPNLDTRLFEGPGLFAEFIEFFSELGQAEDLGGMLDGIAEASLRQRMPALYREWRQYRLQHGLLAGRSFAARVPALLQAGTAVSVLLSDEADAAAMAGLPAELARNGWLRQFAGSHTGFLLALDAQELMHDHRVAADRYSLV